MTNQSKCHDYMELLDAYLDDELEASQRIEVDKHFLECVACVKELEEMSKLASALRSLPQLKPSGQIDFSFLVKSDCKPIIDLLDAYYDCELSLDEHERVEKHLAQCVPCRRSVKEIERLVLGLKSLPQLTPERDMVGSLEAKELKGNAPDQANCAAIIEMLDSYHDEELNQDEKLRIDNHLAACEKCQENLFAIKRLVEGIKLLPRLHPSRDIAGQIDYTGSNIVCFRKKIWLGLGTVAAAALALIICLNFKQLSGGINTKLAANSVNNVIRNKTKAIIPETTNTAGAESENNESNLAKSANDTVSTDKRTIVSANNMHLLANHPNSANVNQTDILETRHEAINSENELASGTDNEVAAAIPDSGNAAGADALGIDTDKDGLYDIKI